MPSPDLTEAVRRRAFELGFDACRITSAEPPESAPQFQAALAEGRHAEMHWLARNSAKRADPQRVLAGARSVVVVAVSYAGDAESARSTRVEPDLHPAKPGGEPRGRPSGIVARYARYTDYHDLLGAKLRELTVFLRETGGTDVRSVEYVDTGPVLERDLGQRAGIGFIGKHTNLISRRLGNWFLLGEVLTTLELQADTPEDNHCGSCRRCLTACPTNALPAPFTLDARRCISYLTIEHKGSIPLELRPLMGDRIFGCDDCLAVCPWNRFARLGALMQPHARPDLAQPDLVELLGLSEVEFKERFRNTPVLRAKRRGLLRNVCVALGNVGGPLALPALERAIADPEPLVAEHAVWAIARIRSGELDFPLWTVAPGT